MVGETMKKKLNFLIVIFQLLLWSLYILNQFGIGPAWAVREAELERPEGISDEEWVMLRAKKELPYDKGPGEIDVSKYPKEMQDIYEKEFKPKCSKCHTIARPINAPYVLPEEWKKYIRRMQNTPGSGITPMAAKKIYEFLCYDSEIRKSDLYEKRLREK